MNTRRIFRMYHITRPAMICRSIGTYKVIKRPDPKTLKMPEPGSCPSVMEILKEKIRLKGPLTISEYMHICITNPTEGYYMKKDTISPTGDFVTSPEISQLFGEILTIWFLSETRKMYSGKPLQLVELGPGNATLMSDILRVLHRAGYKAEDLSIHFVEISDTMKKVQAGRLCSSHRETDLDLPYNHEGETASGIKVFWYNDVKKVPMNFSWYIAHEFFDVMPINKFIKTDDGWREILIDLDENGFYYRPAGEETPAQKMLVRPPLDCGERTELEISAQTLGISRILAERVDAAGGLALIADYGHEGDKEDTFRAFYKHEIVDPLKIPGECDLTADVDFSQIRLAVCQHPNRDNYAIVVGPVTQKTFLERMQADVRLEVLLKNAKSDEIREKVELAYKMLVDPKQMGERFKFMAFYPPSVKDILEKFPPLGFSKPLEEKVQTKDESKAQTKEKEDSQ